MRLLVGGALLVAFAAVAPRGHGSTMERQNVLLAKKAKKSKKSKKSRKARRAKVRSKKKSSKKSKSVNGVQLGGGIWTVYPPMLAAQGYYRYGSVSFGGIFGYVTIPVSEFSGTSSLLALSGRWHPSPKWSLGLDVGQRSFEITTNADLNHENGPTTIEWTRQVNQTVLNPHVAYAVTDPAKKSMQFLFQLGIVLPMSSELTVTRDVETVEGVPNDVLEDEQVRKGEDVTRVTNAVLPSIGFQMLWPL